MIRAKGEKQVLSVGGAIVGSRIAVAIQVLGAAVVHVLFEMRLIIRLDEGDFVLGVVRFSHKALVVVVAQFVDVPNGDARGRQVGIPSILEMPLILRRQLAPIVVAILRSLRIPFVHGERRIPDTHKVRARRIPRVLGAVIAVE